MLGRSLRPASLLRSIPLPRSFQLRLFGAFTLVLLIVGGGLYMVQSQAARRMAIADGAATQFAYGQFIEHAFEFAKVNGDPWNEVREVLTHVSAQSGFHEALVISASGVVVAATAAAEEGTEHRGSAAALVLSTGEPAFAVKVYGGHEAFEYLSRIRLGGEWYVFEVELEPVLLTNQLDDFRRTFLLALALSFGLAFPLLYLLGGRTLASQFRAAEDQSTLDGLTGLNNHRSFLEALDQEVARAHRFGPRFTLALVDIDDFKFVNDSRGHQGGDDVLVRLAAVLRTGRSVDRAFRIGGDEFALIMPDTGLDDAVEPVERFRLAALRRMGGPTISVGLAESDPTDTNAAELRERADKALYEAKRRGRNGVVKFTEIDASTPMDTSVATMTAVRHLLTSRQMGAAFQPIWNLDTQRVIGYEGLARPAEESGLAGPQEAFSGAARLGRIDELDALCRESVLARVTDLPDDVLLFLNIASEVFDHGGEAAQRIRHEVEAAGLHPARVVIELTEHTSDRMHLVIPQVQELRDLGFPIALDGVGSGDGGLALLGRVRPDYVKVGREVVHSARDGGSGRAVLAAIVAYATESGAGVIIEGIEMEDMLHLVRGAEAGTKRARFVGAQGYLLGRPDTDPPWQSATDMTWPLPRTGPAPSPRSI
ncbi:MAG: EAL domain-containing protein [Actinomycetota bacterium]|nr:EAL domain-containing protein [Actinomycetota bacterium]